MRSGSRWLEQTGLLIDLLFILGVFLLVFPFRLLIFLNFTYMATGSCTGVIVFFLLLSSVKGGVYTVNTFYIHAITFGSGVTSLGSPGSNAQYSGFWQLKSQISFSHDMTWGHLVRSGRVGVRVYTRGPIEPIRRKW